MNYEEILKRVMDGESADDIAKEMTDMLNKAAAEKKAADAAKVTEVENKKALLGDAMAKSFNEYAILCGKENPGVTGADICELVNGLMDLATAFGDLKIGFSTKKIPAKKAKKSADDVFATFFKELGI